MIAGERKSCRRLAEYIVPTRFLSSAFLCHTDQSSRRLAFYREGPTCVPGDPPTPLFHSADNVLSSLFHPPLCGFFNVLSRQHVTSHSQTDLQCSFSQGKRASLEKRHDISNQPTEQTTHIVASKDDKSGRPSTKFMLACVADNVECRGCHSP